MAVIDIFNGDADGICALTQLRLAQPRESRLVTGVKRDIALLAKAGIEAGDEVTALDISMDKNRPALDDALARGATVFYVDHHYPGEVPAHAGLTALINTAADVCTSLLVNGHLRGTFAEWAAVGAFGDNLKSAAQTLLKPLGLPAGEVELLERLGLYINYNGYGASLGDLHFPPAELYRLLSVHRRPLAFATEDKGSFDKLQDGYREDMGQVTGLAPEMADERAAVYLLPDQPWARRVSGVFSNDLANGHPERAHAVLTAKAGGNYLVSVRAPLAKKSGADEICRQFPTGGGRKAAAGINDLPAAELSRFIDVFRTHYAAD